MSSKVKNHEISTSWKHVEVELKFWPPFDLIDVIDHGSLARFVPPLSQVKDALRPHFIMRINQSWQMLISLALPAQLVATCSLLDTHQIFTDIGF